MAKYIATYLYKEHRKEVLTIFTARYQKEAKNYFWNSNNRSLYSNEKVAQDIIDEKPFAWLKLPDNFSLNSNKRSRTDDPELDIDDAMILLSKTVDFFISSTKRGI